MANMWYVLSTIPEQLCPRVALIAKDFDISEYASYCKPKTFLRFTTPIHSTSRQTLIISMMKCITVILKVAVAKLYGTRFLRPPKPNSTFGPWNQELLPLIPLP